MKGSPRTLGIRSFYLEGLQGQHYSVGQEFKKHTDFFEPYTEEYAKHGAESGNRTREYILDDATGAAELKQLQRAIIPEIAAAVAKIMSNKDLVLAAAKIRNITRCRNTMGESGYWASAFSRTIQPMM